MASPLSPGGCHAPATLWRAHSSSSPSNVFPLWVPAPHRWEGPRRAEFLQRFRELYFEIEEFLLVDEHAEYNQLRDDQWLLDFVFLTDLLSGLHFELRGKDRTVVRVIRSVHALKWLMRHLSWKLQTQRKACACRGRTNAFKTTLLYFEPAATFIDVEDESLATLFHLNSPLERTFRWRESLWTWGNVLPSCISWLYFFAWVSLFPHEEYWVQIPFHRDWWWSLLEAGQQLLSTRCTPGWFSSVIRVKLWPKMYNIVLCVCILHI